MHLNARATSSVRAERGDHDSDSRTVPLCLQRAVWLEQTVRGAARASPRTSCAHTASQSRCEASAKEAVRCGFLPCLEALREVDEVEPVGLALRGNLRAPCLDPRRQARERLLAEGPMPLVPSLVREQGVKVDRGHPHEHSADRKARAQASDVPREEADTLDDVAVRYVGATFRDPLEVGEEHVGLFRVRAADAPRLVEGREHVHHVPHRVRGEPADALRGRDASSQPRLPATGRSADHVEHRSDHRSDAGERTADSTRGDGEDRQHLRVDERPLPGGATGAARAGDEVLRAAGPWTPSVHALMDHVRNSGLSQVPAVFGLTADGARERLAWIEADEAPAAVADLRALRKVGALVRAVHDALGSFTAPETARWRGRERGERFVHGDISPWNVLWRDGDIVGLLDWDQAGPGRDLEDIAYAAWVWVPIADPSRPEDHWLRGHFDAQEQGRRMLALAEGFGLTLDERRRLLEEVAVVEAETAARIGSGAVSGDDGLARIWWGGRRVGDLGASMVWLDEAWDALEAGLLA